MNLCSCGSGKPRRELKDARGIFCAFVCDRCEWVRRSEFNGEIFIEPDYLADEDIEGG